MRCRNGIARALVAVLCGCGVQACCPTESFAQEEGFFKPVVEAPPTKTPVGGQHVYSFSRWDPEFTALCIELEHEGRRDRLVRIAESAMERDKDSITSRAFWKMIVGACGRLGPKPTKAPTPNKVATREARAAAKEEKPTAPPSEAPADSSDSSGASAEGTATAVVTPNPSKLSQGERYPSVALLDQVSRLSSTLYEADSGEGATANMLRYFAKTVRETHDLTSNEREYYDILFTYLLAAWEGRVDTTKLPTPTPSAALRSLFNFD